MTITREMFTTHDLATILNRRSSAATLDIFVGELRAGLPHYSERRIYNELQKWARETLK